MEKRFFTQYIEFDRWSGPSTILVKEFSSYEEAKETANTRNALNTESSAPDVYIVAKVSNDLNLTQNKYYKDCRNV